MNRGSRTAVPALPPAPRIVRAKSLKLRKTVDVAPKTTLLACATVLSAHTPRDRGRRSGVTGPQYPNQQLRSVSLETFFPGRFSMLAGLERLQSRVGSELPNLFVPNV